MALRVLHRLCRPPVGGLRQCGCRLRGSCASGDCECGHGYSRVQRVGRAGPQPSGSRHTPPVRQHRKWINQLIPPTGHTHPPALACTPSHAHAYACAHEHHQRTPRRCTLHMRGPTPHVDPQMSREQHTLGIGIDRNVADDVKPRPHRMSCWLHILVLKGAQGTPAPQPKLQASPALSSET